MHTTIPFHEESLPHRCHPEQSTGWWLQGQGQGRLPLPCPVLATRQKQSLDKEAPFLRLRSPPWQDLNEPGVHDPRTRLSTWCHAPLDRRLWDVHFRDQLLQPTILKSRRTSDTPGVQIRS